MREELRELTEKILLWGGLGEKVYGDGTMLTGHIPHKGPLAYLHQRFPPADMAKAEAVEAELGSELPADYRELVSWSDGLFLFHLSLGFYGIVSSTSRSMEYPPRPFSVLQYNKRERPPQLDREFFVVGGYGFDGTKILLDGEQAVWLCERRDGEKRIKISDSIFRFLLDEFARLSLCFDVSGVRIVDGSATVPRLVN